MTISEKAVEEVGETVQSGFKYNPQYFSLVIIVMMVFGYIGFIQWLKDKNDTMNMQDQNQILKDGFKQLHEDELRTQDLILQLKK